MESNPETRLLVTLSGDGESGENGLASSRVGWRFRYIEESVAAVFGGRPHRRLGSRRRPDFVIERDGKEPIAAEVKVVDASLLRSNLRNRINELMAASVETRRAFQEPIVLCAILLVAGSLARPDLLLDRAFAARVSQLLRQDDGVGYESVIVGYATDRLHWHYFGVDDRHGLSLGSPLPNEVDVAEVVTRLHGQQAAPPARGQSGSGSDALRLLFVADEWRSRRGGISTINRELAIAVARLDAEVAVMVPTCTDEEQKLAADAHVSLVVPARVEGLTHRELMLLKPRFAEGTWIPDVVVGHGRVLGPYAKALQQEHFPQARRVHVVHTAAESLEAAKEAVGGPSRMMTANKRATLEYELARSADLVVAIGPLLADSTRDELIGPGTPPRVLELVPGLRVVEVDTPVPTRNQVLVVGRAEDFRSKGIDIAVDALLQVAAGWPDGQLHRPSLVLRGVPDEAANEIKSRIESVVQGRLEVFLRPYVESEEVVRGDFLRSKVVLMPSRHEGFGLSAYEAIATGVPVLISAESGLAMFLMKHGLDTSPSSVVAAWGLGSDEVASAWASGIEWVLRKPNEARQRAAELRGAIEKVASWERCAEQLLDALKDLR